MAGATAAAQALSRGELGHFPSFIAGINQCISALHTNLIFSEAQPDRAFVADLASQLSEALALLGTAQRELATKSQLLEVVEQRIASLGEVESQIDGWSKEAEEGATATTGHKVKAAEALSQTQESASQLETLKSSAAGLLTGTEETAGVIAKQKIELDAIIIKATKQEQLIADLLPKGASAGLASAFAGRVHQLEIAKRAWAAVFIISIGSLTFLSYELIELQKLNPVPMAAPLWQQILQKVALGAPLIWLGWVSAIQYVNTLMVQEDYAFKEATSKAFAGYRDHMAYLANVDLEDGNTAMTLMAQRTIEILARDPLRIFQDIGKDSAPSQSFIDLFRGGSSKPEANPPAK
ncbi:MAG: hypothetical protein EXQ56_07300 [Acidobacteria bacterium]|nr:hypothetical protein [Acidobacteriota bacterium]